MCRGRGQASAALVTTMHVWTTTPLSHGVFHILNFKLLIVGINEAKACLRYPSSQLSAPALSLGGPWRSCLLFTLQPQCGQPVRSLWKSLHLVLKSLSMLMTFLGATGDLVIKTPDACNEWAALSGFWGSIGILLQVEMRRQCTNGTISSIDDTRRWTQQYICTTWKLHRMTLHTYTTIHILQNLSW